MASKQVPAEQGHTHAAPAASMPWEQQAGESGAAHQALLAFRDLGPKRTLRAAAERVGKSRGLLAGWSARYRWEERVLAWDRQQQREAEAALRTAREEALRRQAQDADNLQRLAMAKLGRLVRRDPATGEPQLDPSVTVQDAVRVYRLGLEIERTLPSGPEAAPEEAADQKELKRMTDEELRRLIALAKERAGTDGEEENGDDN